MPIPVLTQDVPDVVPEPTPEPDDTPDETPIPTAEPTPVPEPVPVPTYHPESEDNMELEPGDDPVVEVVKEQPEPETELGDDPVPMDEGQKGRGAAWALVNFTLMNLAVFESVMLLIGYFIQTKKRKKKEEKDSDKNPKEKKLRKHGIIRVLSIVVAVVSVIAFILTEDITLPTGFVDRWTLLMLIIAIVQTIVVIFSRKEEKPAYQVEILESEECEVSAEPFCDVEPDTKVILSVCMREEGDTLIGYEVRDSGNNLVAVEDGKFCMPESDVTVRVFCRETR